MLDQKGRVIAGAAVSWSSTDASVASVDGSGLVTAAGYGTATITATAGSASGHARVTAVESSEWTALVALYNATDGANWVNNDNWLTNAPLGDWYGVQTDHADRVVGLDLRGRWDGEAQRPIPHGLSGSIPPELGNLANMDYLELGLNNLTGPIPPELGNLASLTELYLWGNNLTGPIAPELTTPDVSRFIAPD